MPDENQTPPEINDQSTPTQLREALDRATERARGHEEAAGLLPGVQRENAMLRAGVDLDSPLGQVFSRGYDGELDTAAIREAYSAIAPQPATPPATPEEEQPPAGGQPDPEAIERQRRLEALNSGSTPPGQEPDEHPWTAAHAEFVEGQRRRTGRDRAAAAAFDGVLDAAVKGDKRVIYDPRRPYSEQYNPL